MNLEMAKRDVNAAEEALRCAREASARAERGVQMAISRVRRARVAVRAAEVHAHLARVDSTPLDHAPATAEDR